MNKRRLQSILIARQVCFLAAAFEVFAIPSLAQPAMSRGQQFLKISNAECLNRAVQALRNTGFSASQSGNFAQGFREISGAYIICNEIPTGGNVVNIVVASGTQDAGVPGNLRQLLQAQMDRPASGPVVGTSPQGTGPLVGTWTLNCCKGAFQWEMTIKSQNGNTFSGVLSDVGYGGDINGQLRGNTIEFVRSGAWGKQTWTGQLVGSGGVLRMVNGTWTGDYLETFRGRNEWSADKR